MLFPDRFLVLSRRYSKQRMKWLAIPASLLVSFATESVGSYAQELPGSTMTLEQLQHRTSINEQPLSPLMIEAAAEPVPALRYRLYPAHWDLKPGTSQLHFSRAMILRSQVSQHSREAERQWEDWATRDSNPTDLELRKAVESLSSVYAELHHMALSEDMKWDHRIRDLRGPDVYAFLLPDVQDARELSRLLRMKVRYQIRQRDFEGAISTLSDGFRLAEFVGQGETLIQKLVGIAIASQMRDGIEEAIGTPGCPNLYWAIATIPRDIVDVREAALWELSNIHSVFPVLTESETETWSDAEAAEKWAKLVDDLGVLTDDGGSGALTTRLTLAVASVTLVDSARSRLLSGGVSKERLSKLPALQIVLMDASRELRRAGNELGKAFLLPPDIAIEVIKREDSEFQEWIRNQRSTSVGAAIASALFPASVNVLQAETRMQLGQNRLMVLEALRMYAAEHDGRLPTSLDQLSTAPAVRDPFSNTPFEYRVETVDGGQKIILKAQGPTNFRPLQELNAILGNP